MLLFKVWTADRKKKCFILTDPNNAVLNLIAAASQKLGIDGSSLVLERDGTPINEDDILILLQKETIILLEPAEQWTDDSIQDNVSVTTSKASTVTVVSSDFSDYNKADNISSDNILESSIDIDVPTMMVDSNMEYLWTTFKIPWDKLPKDTLLACEKGSKQKQVHTQVIHMVANEMRSIKNNPSSKAARIVAQKMIAKYPATFQDIDDDGVILGDGSISVYMRLYERLSYLNRPHKRPGSDPSISKKKIKHAVAGCSSWNPDVTTLEEEEITVIRQKLNSFKDDEVLCEEMERLLEKTFPVQREFLNNAEKMPTVQHIKNEWPILFNKNAIIWHFNKITNVNLNNCLENLEQKHERIMKFDKDKVSAKATEDKYLQVLYVISRYFKEDLSKIYFKVEKRPSEEEIGFEPCIVEVVSDTEKEILIYFEKKHVVTANAFGEALKLLFGIYFVFNLVYPKSASCILEFLQRYIFKIHPDEGTKSKKMNMSKRKVISFLNKLSSS